MLSIRVDAIPNAIVAATFHAVVIPAINGVVAHLVLETVAVSRAAFNGGHQRKPESKSHCRRVRPGVEVEVEQWRRRGINPVSRVRENQGMEPDFVPRTGISDEASEQMRINLGRKLVLIEVSRE